MEIIAKQSQKLIKGLDILLYFSLAFLFFSIVSYFLLDHFFKQTQEEIKVREPVLASLINETKIAPEKLALRREFLSYQKKINDFNFLMNQRLENLRFFENFETIIHPYVWFSEINLNSRERMVVLSGQAQSFEVLEQQFLVLKDQNWLKNISLGSVSIAEGGKIDFNLSFSFDLSLLNSNE